MNKRANNRNQKRSYASRVLLLIFLLIIGLLLRHGLQKGTLDLSTPFTLSRKGGANLARFERDVTRSFTKFNLLRKDVTRKEWTGNGTRYCGYTISINPSFSLYAVNDLLSDAARRNHLTQLKGTETTDANGRRTLVLTFDTGDGLEYEFRVLTKKTDSRGAVASGIILVFDRLGRHYGPATRQIMETAAPLTCIINPKYTTGNRIAEAANERGFDVISDLRACIADFEGEKNPFRPLMSALFAKPDQNRSYRLPHIRGFAVPDADYDLFEQSLDDFEGAGEEEFLFIGISGSDEGRRRATHLRSIPYRVVRRYADDSHDEDTVAESLERLYELSQENNVAAGIFPPVGGVVKILQKLIPLYEKKGVTFVTFSGLLH